MRLWDLQGNAIGQPFQGHTDGVLSVAFSPDGSQILSGSWDKTVRLWDLQGNAIGKPFQGHEDRVNSVPFFPGWQPDCLRQSGQYDAAVGFAGQRDRATVSGAYGWGLVSRLFPG